MSDDRTPTPEEILANVDKMKAEAELARAQAREAAATTAVAEAEAHKTRNEAEASDMVIRAARYEEAYDQATDEFHRVYHFLGQVSVDSVKVCMKKLSAWQRMDPTKHIEIVFDSPGGDVIAGLALFDHIRLMQVEDGTPISTGTLGHAASMGSILVQAGGLNEESTRWMGAEAWCMIHRTAFGAMGKSWEIIDRAEWVERVEARIIDIFTCDRTNLSKRVLKKNWERKDWWLSSDECLTLKLVDRVRGGGFSASESAE